MKTFIKFILILIVSVIFLGFTEQWYNMFLLGRYWAHAAFMPTMFVGAIIPLSAMALFVMLIGFIVRYK